MNRLGGLSLPRKSVVRVTDRPDMTLDVYRGRKTTNQQQQQPACPDENFNPTKTPSLYNVLCFLALNLSSITHYLPEEDSINLTRMQNHKGPNICILLEHCRKKQLV